MRYNYNNNSNANDEPECDDNSDAKSDNEVLFDFKDDKSDNNTTNKDINGHSCLNSSYNSDGINITIIKDINKYYTTKLDECR